jgi:hypothetical protein
MGLEAGTGVPNGSKRVGEEDEEGGEEEKGVDEGFECGCFVGEANGSEAKPPNGSLAAAEGLPLVLPPKAGLPKGDSAGMGDACVWLAAGAPNSKGS